MFFFHLYWCRSWIIIQDLHKLNDIFLGVENSLQNLEVRVENYLLLGVISHPNRDDTILFLDGSEESINPPFAGGGGR